MARRLLVVRHRRTRPRGGRNDHAGGEPRRDPGRRPGERRRPDRPRPHARDADISLEVSGFENISIADLAANIERLDMNFLTPGDGQARADGAVDPPPPARIAGRRDPRAARRAHHQPVEAQLHPPGPGPLEGALLPTDLMGADADQILLVAQFELASLRNVVRLVHCLGGEENLQEGSGGDQPPGGGHHRRGHRAKKAEEVIGKPIFWQIPNDPKPVIAARVAGHPLVKHAPKSRVQQSIQGLAQRCTASRSVPRGGEQEHVGLVRHADPRVPGSASKQHNGGGPR